MDILWFILVFSGVLPELTNRVTAAPAQGRLQLAVKQVGAARESLKGVCAGLIGGEALRGRRRDRRVWEGG